MSEPTIDVFDPPIPSADQAPIPAPGTSEEVDMKAFPYSYLVSYQGDMGGGQFVTGHIEISRVTEWGLGDTLGVSEYISEFNGWERPAVILGVFPLRRTDV